MGLLDSVLGAVMGNGQENAQGGKGGKGATALGGLGGLGGLMALAAQNPQLVKVVMGMLANDGGQGGLGGLIAKFTQAGQGDVISSWLGNGPNEPVSGDQLTQVLGQDTMAQMGQQAGMGAGDLAGLLSRALPSVIDRLSPQGQAPAGGVGNTSDLMVMLGGLLQK